MAEIYRQIAYELESGFGQMRRENRMRLPTESELCKKYSCSRQTVRSALDLLAQKGLIVKVRGSGSYISDDTDPLNSKVFLIIEDEDEYIYPESVSALRLALKKNGYDLKCFSTKGSYEKERDALCATLQECPCAVLIEPISNILPSHNKPLLEDIGAKGIPVIYLYTSYPFPEDAICIKEDNAQGADKLVSHLKDNGHTNISCIFRCDDSRGLERYKGYVDSLFGHGLPFDEKNVCLFTRSDRKKLLYGNDDFLQRAVAQMPSDSTAIICQNDEIAYRLLKVLGKNRRSDVAVVSFDNSYYASGSSGITSLGHSSKELTKTITDAIASAARGKMCDPQPVCWHLHTRSSG